MGALSLLIVFFDTQDPFNHNQRNGVIVCFEICFELRKPINNK